MAAKFGLMLANLKFSAALAVVFDRAGVSGAVLQIPVNHEFKKKLLTDHFPQNLQNAIISKP